MVTKRTFILLGILVTLVACAAFALASLIQKRAPNRKSDTLKLEYSNPNLSNDNYSPPVVSPIAIRSDRLLVPVGDTLYMLDSKNQIAWECPFEPNIIQDVMVDSRGDIYITLTDGLLLALNASGKEVWRTGLNGSAGYGQIKSYGDGFLVVVDMEGYRMKGSNSEDTLQFWKDRKLSWSKEFPRGAKLQLVGNRIVAITTTKEGREIKEIR